MGCIVKMLHARKHRISTHMPMPEKIIIPPEFKHEDPPANTAIRKVLRSSRFPSIRSILFPPCLSCVIARLVGFTLVGYFIYWIVSLVL